MRRADDYVAGSIDFLAELPDPGIQCAFVTVTATMAVGRVGIERTFCGIVSRETCDIDVVIVQACCVRRSAVLADAGSTHCAHWAVMTFVL
ncbi:hypothetical protein NY08_3668 [Rhodococcus sp. B7740]|nr:hypothetical protein NY08_3668 [Rhodococcus sp. B7740]